MYTCPASVVDFDDVIQYTDYKGDIIIGKVKRISYSHHQSGVRCVDLTLDNGLQYYTDCKTRITILEMNKPDSPARTRNNPNNWKMLGIEKVVKSDV